MKGDTEVVLYVVFFFVGFLVALIAQDALSVTTTENNVSYFLAAVQAAGTVAVAFSAFTAYRLYRASLRRHEQEDERKRQEDQRKRSDAYLKESIELLARAYETFTRASEIPPKNDRLLWLSTARMILRFRRMREKITEPEHKEIADEHEEYVRLKFYTLLNDSREHLTLEYFKPDEEPNGMDAIALKSIAVIFDFSHWREGMDDPLDVVDEKELFAKRVVPIDFFGVEAYIAEDQGYWEEIQRRIQNRHGG